MEDEFKPSRPIVLAIRASGLVVAEPINSKPPLIEIDTISHFVTYKTTKNRDEMIKWTRVVAEKLKFAIVIEKSDYSGDKRKLYFVLGCERGGLYVPTKKKLKFDQTGTRKCGCPFRLRGYYHASKEWHLSVVCGKHNHEFDKELEGHLIAGRLKSKEKEFLDEMTRNLVSPRNIISTLKERDPENNGPFGAPDREIA